MLEKFNSVIEEIKRTNDSTLLYYFVDENIQNNREELLNLIDPMMEYTNGHSYGWLSFFKDDEEALDRITKAISHYDLYKLDINYFNILTVLNNCSLDLAKVIALKNLHILDRKNIFVFLCHKDKKLASTYLENILFLSPSEVSEFVTVAKSNGIFDIIEENIEKIVSLTDDEEYLLSLYEDNDMVSSIIKKLFKEKEEVLVISPDKEKDEIRKLYYLLVGHRRLNDATTKTIKERESVIDVLYYIVKEVCDSEQVSFKDIFELGSGSYCRVFQIGDKVVKIGTGRMSDSFPNNPYIVKPLLRKHFIVNNSEERIFIEVTERVKTDIKISKEELYELYKKLRDIGLIWGDVAERNVGMLLKDNNIHFRDPRLNPSDEALGLLTSRGEETLRRGDLVILDADFIFEEGKIPPSQLTEGGIDYYREVFEKRYQREKEKKKEGKEL